MSAAAGAGGGPLARGPGRAFRWASISQRRPASGTYTRLSAAANSLPVPALQEVV